MKLLREYRLGLTYKEWYVHKFREKTDCQIEALHTGADLSEALIINPDARVYR